MKTFEEIQAQIELNHKILLQNAMETLQDERITKVEKKTAELMVHECQSVLNNLEEVTRIEIGAATNELIDAVKKMYQIYPFSYGSRFDDFLEKYVTGMNNEGKFVAQNCSGQMQCVKLGLMNSDLNCFKDYHPMKPEFGNVFRQMINQKFGTTIPMAGTVEKALQDYESVMFTDDSFAKDNALIYLKELQRDSGHLKNGYSYLLLQNDKEYQEAQARCRGKSF